MPSSRRARRWQAMTVAALCLGAAPSLYAGPADAQSASNQPAGTTVSEPATGSSPSAGEAAPPATAPATGSGSMAASGNDNQAVATTNRNAAQPAHGANSFTLGEARRRIERQGYTHVTGLHRNGHGLWVGAATKAGRTLGVWVDYKGNVGVMPGQD